MLRWLPIALAVLSGLLLPLRADAEEKRPVRRILVVPAIPAAAGGVRLAGADSAAAADLLARSLGQVRGIVVTNPTAAYHGVLGEAGPGATTPAAVAKVARALQADVAILVEAVVQAQNARITGQPILPEGDGGKAPAPVTRQMATTIPTDLFKLQSDFVRAALAALGVKPSQQETTRITLVLGSTASRAALDLYKFARQQMPLASLEAYDFAVEALRQAVGDSRTPDLLADGEKATGAKKPADSGKPDFPVGKDPEFALGHAALAEAAAFLNMQQALTGIRDDRLKTLSVSAAARAVALRPELPDTHRAMALAHTLVGNHRRAAEEAEKALAIQPDDPEALLWLSLTRGPEGKPDVAKALALDPSLPMGHLFLAVLAASDGDQKTMDAEGQKALQLSPLDPSPLLLAGLIRTGEGKVDDAIASYQRVLKLNGRTALAHAAIARLYYRTGRAQEAADALKQAFALDFRVAEMLRQQALFYQENGQPEEAEKEYQLILLADPKDTPALRGLGRVALARGKIPQAIEHFRKALEISPKDAWAYIGLAMCHQRAGRDDMAVSQLKAAAEAQPEEGFVFFYLAQAYERQRRTREAGEAYDKALKLSPLYPDVAYYRAQFYQKHNPERALEAWRTYLNAAETTGAAALPGEQERVRQARQRLGMPVRE